MKKLLALLLVILMCVSALTLVACFPSADNGEGGDNSGNTGNNGDNNNQQTVEYDLEGAKEYLEAYFEDESTTTPSDYEVPSQLPVGNYTYTVTWTSDNTEVVVEVANGKTLINVNEKSSEDLTYTLTATITAGDGTTTTYTRTCNVPKYVVLSFEEYMQAASGDVVTIEGVVVAMNGKSVGNSRNHLFLADAEGKGGYYCYQLDDDPVAAGVELGMTVTVTATVTPYSGMQETKGGTFKIVSEEKTTVDVKDITADFVAGNSLKNYVGLPVTIKGVTIGSQSLAKDTDQYLYFELNGKQSYLRTYITDFPTTLQIVVADDNSVSSPDKTAIDEAHAAHRDYTANVTGILVLYSDAPYLIPMSTDCFEYLAFVEKTDDEKIEAVIEEDLVIPERISENTVLNLPLVGSSYDDVTIAWTIDNANYVIDADGKLSIELGDEEVTLTLTATLTCGDTTSAAQTFTVKVSAAATDLYVPEVALPAVNTAFKLVIFQNKLGKTLYFVGTTADVAWNLATSENVNDAVDVYLEAVDGVEGGYRLYFYDGETKTYIRAYERTASETAGKGSGSLELVTEAPTEYYTYDADLQTLVVTAPNGLSKYYLGAYNDKSVFSCSNTSYVTSDNLGSTQFPANLATLAPAAYDAVVEAPAVDTAFKLVIFQNKLGQTLYFVGTTADVAWNLATSENVNDAVDVYLEAVDGVEGGYRLYFYNGETKTYIRAYERTASETAGKGSGSLELVTEAPTEYYTYDADLRTLVVTAPNGLSKYYLGAYNDKSVFSCSNTSYVTSDNLGSTQFPANLATLVAKKVAPEVQTPEVEKAFKLVIFQNKLGKTLYFVGTTADVAWNLATTEKISQAVDVYLEAVDGVEGGYRLYFYDGETKTYIRAYERTASETAGKGSGSLELVTEAPTEYYTYDADLQTLVVTAPNGLSKYYLGAYNDKSVFSCSNTSYVTSDNLGSTQFPANLATIEFVVEEVHVHEFADATCTAPKTCECGATEGEATGHDISDNVCANCGAKVVTVTEAAALEDGTLVLMEGTVSEITYNWSDSNGNMSVNITDGTTTLNAFKLATKVGVGDVIVVYGNVSSYDGAKQIGAGATAEIKTAYVEPAATTLATFEFGENKEVTDDAEDHVDGSDLAEGSTFTDGDYTLTITGIAKVYQNAYDEMGNSALKLGTSSKVATLTFTVGEDVDKVVIKIAGYKAKTAVITINGGTAQSITSSSNAGEYTDIVIDTTETKTITIATTSSGYRAMIDAILFQSIVE